jgi:hypothetical protein
MSGFGVLADVLVILFSVRTASYDIRFQGPSLHGRWGQRMCHFDDRLAMDLRDLEIPLLSYSGVRLHSRNDWRADPNYRRSRGVQKDVSLTTR